MPALILPSASPLALPRLAVPAFIRRLGDPLPKPPGEVTVTIHRQPVGFAADHQAALLERWRGMKSAPPVTLARDLADAGLLRHCGYFDAAPGGPLTCRRFADATVRALGVGWARSMLGRPDHADPHSEYSTSLAEHYREAIEGGEPVYNHLVIHGLAAPIVYSHLLMGWASPSGRRALLTVIDWPG